MMKRYKALFVVALVSMLAIGLYAGMSVQIMNMRANVGIRHVGVLNTVIWRKGEVIYNYTTHNLLTTIGATYLESWVGLCGTLNTTARNATQWITLSTDATPLISWTRLANELNNANGLGRALGACTQINVTCFQVQVTFTATGSQAGIICEGEQWTGVLSSDNNLFAVAPISAASVISGDTILATWTNNFPAA
jgi:hypothetical protein